MNESDLKQTLAEAEAHFGRHAWDEAISCFEAVLREHPRHGAALQGRADALQQQSIDAELGETVAEARAALVARQYGEALAALNRAQARGAMHHILRYHSEIDGIRTQAIEGQEWQRRVDAALSEARRLAAGSNLDAALDTLDAAWHDLTVRGLDELAGRLRLERERLWSERDLGGRVAYATAALERQDFNLANELAEALRAEAPGREDVRRLYERCRLAGAGFGGRLAAAQAALAEGRMDDAVAVLAAMRREWPQNPDWQGLWLKAHMDHGRARVEAGRSAAQSSRFDEALAAFGAARAALAAAIEVYPEHPAAGPERAEADSLYAVSALAVQAARDGATGRWVAAHGGWQAARARLAEAVAVRGHDFVEIAAVLDGMARQSAAVGEAIEAARLNLARAEDALASHEPGRAAEHFAAGLAGLQDDVDGLRGRLLAGMADAARIQDEARSLLAQATEEADRAAGLDLLRRAHARWHSAPGLPGILVESALACAREALDAGDEGLAERLCAEVAGIPGVATGQREQSAQIARRVEARRQVQAALAEAERSLQGGPAPASPAAYARRVAALESAALHARAAPELQPAVERLLAEARTHHARLREAGPLLDQVAHSRAVGDWSAAAAALGEARGVLGELAGPDLAQAQAEAEAAGSAVAAGLAAGRSAFERAGKLYAAARHGDLAAVRWRDLQEALDAGAAALAELPEVVQGLPIAWVRLQTALAELAANARTLADAHAVVQAGQALEALLILESAAGTHADPVLTAVLRTLRRTLAGEARGRVTALLEGAYALAESGALPAALDSLAEARRYRGAVPALAPDVERLARRLARLGEMAEQVRAARLSAAAGDAPAALAAYRSALMGALEGDSGLPAGARGRLVRMLDLAARLPEAAAEGEALLAATLAESAGEPAVHVHLLAPLGEWWRLACLDAERAVAEMQLALGDPATAYRQARHALVARPGDPAARTMYTRIVDQIVSGLLDVLRNAMANARSLAEGGAFDAALAALDSAVGGAAEVLHALAGDPRLAPALAEAGGLRRALDARRVLAERVEPLVAAARAALEAGDAQGALAALDAAETLDPLAAPPGAVPAALRTLAARRRAEAQRERLWLAAAQVSAALDRPDAGEWLVDISDRLVEVMAEARGLAWQPDEELPRQLDVLAARAAELSERRARLAAILETARAAGEQGDTAGQVAALARASALATGAAAEQVHAAQAAAETALRASAAGPLATARAAWQSGDLSASANALAEALSVAPDEPAALALQARLDARTAAGKAAAMLKAGDHDGALTVAEWALARDPGCSEAQAVRVRAAMQQAAGGALARARSLAAEGRHVEAQTELDRAREADPTHPRLGGTQEELQDAEERDRTAALAPAHEALQRGDYRSALAALASAGEGANAAGAAWPALQAGIAQLAGAAIEHWAQAAAVQAQRALERRDGTAHELEAAAAGVAAVLAAVPAPVPARAADLHAVAGRLRERWLRTRLAEGRAVLAGGDLRGASLLAEQLARQAEAGGLTEGQLGRVRHFGAEVAAAQVAAAEAAQRAELSGAAAHHEQALDAVRRRLAEAASAAEVSAAREALLALVDGPGDSVAGRTLLAEAGATLSLFEATEAALATARKRINRGQYTRAYQGLEGLVEPALPLLAQVQALAALARDLEVAEVCETSDPAAALAVYERAVEQQPGLAVALAAQIAGTRQALCAEAITRSAALLAGSQPAAAAALALLDQAASAGWCLAGPGQDEAARLRAQAAALTAARPVEQPPAGDPAPQDAGAVPFEDAEPASRSEDTPDAHDTRPRPVVPDVPEDRLEPAHSAEPPAAVAGVTGLSAPAPISEPPPEPSRPYLLDAGSAPHGANGSGRAPGEPHVSAGPPPAEPVPAEPVEEPIVGPFDVADWLSNVTPVDLPENEEEA